MSICSDTKCDEPMHDCALKEALEKRIEKLENFIGDFMADCDDDRLIEKWEALCS